MKKLLVLLFSLLFLSSPSVFADDISDFQIEGISIGDSLLDYMTEDEILEGIEKTKDFYLRFNEPHKYAEVYLYKKFEKYDYLSFFIKPTPTSEYISNKNEKYIILSLRGIKDYIEDFDNCLQNRNEVTEDFSEMFPNAQKIEQVEKHAIDPSGNSIKDAVYYKFDSGSDIGASCFNFEENLRLKNNWGEGLSIHIYPKELMSWLSNK